MSATRASTPIIDWLLREGRFELDTAAFVSMLCAKLEASDLDLVRVNLQMRTLHPEVQVQLFAWRRDSSAVPFDRATPVLEHTDQAARAGWVQHITLAHGAVDSAAYRASPVFLLFDGAPRVLEPIEPGAASYKFPILADLAQLGATGYLALPLRFTTGVGGVIGFATRLPGGFDDAWVETLEDILPALTIVAETHSQRLVLRSLLETYVGRGPGALVLRGRIRQGDVEGMQAAIWFSDLRGFTSHAERLEAVELIAWLNEYFAAVAKPIYAAGGEILKFIGDAVLAVFPVTDDRGAAEVCRAAIDAARSANSELEHLNERRRARGLPDLLHGIGLHFGEAQFGNIGTERRLDFTVIGRAVNIASRVEGLCGRLGRTSLATEAVAQHAATPLEPVGEFDLKGVASKVAVFAVG